MSSPGELLKLLVEGKMTQHVLLQLFGPQVVMEIDAEVSLSLSITPIPRGQSAKIPVMVTALIHGDRQLSCFPMLISSQLLANDRSSSATFNLFPSKLVEPLNALGFDPTSLGLLIFIFTGHVLYKYPLCFFFSLSLFAIDPMPTQWW